MKIYHNPRCSKSRETLALIQEAGAEVEIVEYLKKVPTTTELKDILIKLNLSAEDILRKGEQIYKNKFKGMSFSEEEWIQIMTEYPKLIERPIVVRNNKAIIGRPPERVKELF